MEKDGTFQPLREDVNFMNAPFLNGTIDGLGNPIKRSLSPITPSISFSPESTSEEKVFSTAPSPECQEGRLQAATLVHSRTDELAPFSAVTSAPAYTGAVSAAPWIPGGSLPGPYEYFVSSEQSVSPSQYFHPLGYIGDQHTSLLPWRTILHSSSSIESQTTLCPNQLGPVTQLLSSMGDATPQEERVVSFSDWESESLSITSDTATSAPSHPHQGAVSETRGEGEGDCPTKSRPRDQRISLPDGCLPNPHEPRINPSTGTPYQPIRTKAPFPASPTPKHRTNRPSRRAPATTGPARAARDAFLLRCRAEGMSYKQLKEYGNLPEAESTLRGRYRALTKTKQERVRCPVWTDRDVELLRDAVMGRRKDGGKKVRWTDVASDINDKGCSYPFGVMACRKKWHEVEGD